MTTHLICSTNLDRTEFVRPETDIDNLVEYMNFVLSDFPVVEVMRHSIKAILKDIKIKKSGDNKTKLYVDIAVVLDEPDPEVLGIFIEKFKDMFEEFYKQTHVKYIPAGEATFFDTYFFELSIHTMEHYNIKIIRVEEGKIDD